MKKFRDMTDSEIIEVVRAIFERNIVKYKPVENTESYHVYKNDYIDVDGYYEIPKRPMSIDWIALKDEYICAATDIDGDAFAYHEEPELCRSGWGTGGPYFRLNGLKSYDPGQVNWRDSLIWRPGHEPK